MAKNNQCLLGLGIVHATFNSQDVRVRYSDAVGPSLTNIDLSNTAQGSLLFELLHATIVQIIDITDMRLGQEFEEIKQYNTWYK